MRLVSLSGLCLVSSVAAAMAFSACGSSDAKRRPRIDYTNGGEGGVGITGAAGEMTGEVVAGAGGMPATLEPQGGAAGAAAVELTGGAGGEPAVVSIKGLYVSLTGNDTNAGGEVEPFLTLAHAASVAKAGDTIVFLDGTFSIPAPSVVIPAGVKVMAKTSGAVTLKLDAAQGTAASLFTIKGDTRIEGLKFTGHQSVATFAGLSASDTPGTLTIVDSSFTACAVSCLTLSNGAKAVVTSATDAVLNNAGSAFATLTANAVLGVNGGILENAGSGPIVRATDSTLNLTNVQVLDGNPTYAINLRGTTVATLDAVTMSTKGVGLIDVAGLVNLTVKNSDLSIQGVTGVIGIFTTMDGVGSVVIEDTKVHRCGTGFKGAVPGKLTLLRTEVYDINYGMDFVTGATAVGGTVNFTDSKVHDFVNWGFRLGDPSSLMVFKMRGTQITVPGTAGYDGLILAGSNGSTFDLGTLVSPGGNTILGATANITGLRLNMNAATVQAVGNTWTPNVEGADALGKYSAPTANAGDKLDITVAVSTGINYIKTYPTSTLRLAQNP